MNFGGKVHGGAVMKWIDQAGYACAVGWSENYCVTVYVGGIRFYKPVLIGSIVTVRARVVYTGRTSMHLTVDVRARDPKTNDPVDTTHCIIVFVAIDKEGNPMEVRKWTPTSPEDVKLESYALNLMALRQAMEAKLNPSSP
jgi:acyl-CoA hydrolase